MTVHGPVPEHTPDQPVKSDPGLGVAVNVTGNPVTNLSEQKAPQFIPVGKLATVPVPAPDFDTVRVL